MKGKEAEEFWKKLRDFKSEADDSRFTSLLDIYQEKVNKFIEEALKLKEGLYDTFSCQG